MEDELDFIRAAEQTWVVRHPRQNLATFGTTSLSYYVVTEPIYREIQPEDSESVVRQGKVIAQKPAIVTPFYAMNLEGFSDEAYSYFRHLSQQYGPNSPGILYQYRNETEKTDILSGLPNEVANRISDDLDGKKDELSVVMVGVDELWDVSLMKFIYEFTSKSAVENAQELRSRGMFDPSPSAGGIPQAAIQQIEQMFRQVEQGRNPEDLRRELDRWGAFDFYEDRFLNLFRRR
ncbi:MAG: hypothetical protein F4X94_06140 [Dehalococcoidia bacterium]|nr:hypothetical protein [Dehalococcoidia bacterium]